MAQAVAQLNRMKSRWTGGVSILNFNFTAAVRTFFSALSLYIYIYIVSFPRSGVDFQISNKKKQTENWIKVIEKNQNINTSKTANIANCVLGTIS